LVFLLLGRINAKTFSAATLVGARVTLGTAIHTTTATARRWMNLVKRRARVRVDFEPRNTPPTVFFDRAKLLLSTEEMCGLITTALGRSNFASTGSFHGKQLGLCVYFLDCHFERMNLGTANTAETVSVFQTLGDLCAIDKILEFRLRLAAQQFLTPTLARLSNL